MCCFIKLIPWLNIFIFDQYEIIFIGKIILPLSLIQVHKLSSELRQIIDDTNNVIAERNLSIFYHKAW